MTTDLTRTGSSDGPPGEEMELQTHSSAGGVETDLGGSEQQGAESDLGGAQLGGAGLSDSSPSARIEQGHTRDHKPRVTPDSKKTVV